MITITRELTDSIAAISECLSKMHKLSEELGEAMENLTDGKITTTISQSGRDVQLYHNEDKCSTAEALEIIKELADDADVQCTYEDDVNQHYRFKIDRQPMCIVLSKEDN